MRSITIALCLVASVSLAQQPQPTPKPVPVQVVTFGEDEIEGGLKHPTGAIYAVPRRAKFGCLIQVRMNFNDKLQESVHEM